MTNNKFRFINRSTEDNSISLAEDPAGTKKCADVSLKFVPGQDVYFIQNSQIIKTAIKSVKINMMIELHKYESDITYITKEGKEIEEGDIFGKIEDFPIVDNTKAESDFPEMLENNDIIYESEPMPPKKPFRKKNKTDEEEFPF
jgi:hypothetical protein